MAKGHPLPDCVRMVCIVLQWHGVCWHRLHESPFGIRRVRNRAQRAPVTTEGCAPLVHGSRRMPQLRRVVLASCTRLSTACGGNSFVSPAFSLCFVVLQCKVIHVAMSSNTFFISLLRVGSGLFTNLAAAYVFAIYISPNIVLLTNNVLICLVCLCLPVYLDRRIVHE